ncbi:hypothetical protein [Haladaptatus sp. DFWS20]|uniref:hypothetical protein n=1 Tax=Haladaptatus sp. DFWS20 TaxID=3403467 RepID=UPI003EBD653C
MARQTASSTQSQQTASSTQSQQAANSAQSQSSTGSRLLVENPTNQPQLFSLSVSNRPISAYRITDQHGKTKTMKSKDEREVQEEVVDEIEDEVEDSDEFWVESEDEVGGSEDEGKFPSPMQATQITPKSNVIFDKKYTVKPDSAHSFRLQRIPEKGELLYTLKQKSTGEPTFVESWGTMGCNSQFDIYLSPSETRSSCGSQLSEFDLSGKATEHTIQLQGASSGNG